MKIRLVAGLALLLASVPPAPQEASAAQAAGKLCRAYCELVNMVCQAGAAPAGNEEPCVHLYRGCRDGCEIEA
jgi:hypothetical protein